MGSVETAERVYFLGAGASKAIYPKLPLAKDLTLQALLEHDDNYGQSTYKEHAAEPLRIITQVILEHPTISSEPIEQVLGDGRLSGLQRTSVVQCIFLRLYLAEEPPCSLLQNWLTQVRSDGHVIVTTNYDLVCERNLKRLHDQNLVRQSALEWLDYGVPHDLSVKDGNLPLWRRCENSQGYCF